MCCIIYKNTVSRSVQECSKPHSCNRGLFLGTSSFLCLSSVWTFLVLSQLHSPCWYSHFCLNPCVRLQLVTQNIIKKYCHKQYILLTKSIIWRFILPHKSNIYSSNLNFLLSQTVLFIENLRAQRLVAPGHQQQCFINRQELIKTKILLTWRSFSFVTSYGHLIC